MERSFVSPRFMLILAGEFAALSLTVHHLIDFKKLTQAREAWSSYEETS